MFDVGIAKQAGPSFFKDFRYRWVLKRDSDTPNYVIEATFFPTIQKDKWKLRFATMNQISAETGVWRTVWSRELESPETVDLHPIVIH